MKRINRRFWITLAVAVFIGACVIISFCAIISLKIAMEFVTTDKNLRKEEAALSREIVMQLAGVKKTISRIQSNISEQIVDDQKHPCGAKQEADKPLKPCGGKPCEEKPCEAKAERDQSGIPSQPGSQKVEGVTPGANQVKGSARAPVLVVEFSDFACPLSKKFYQETFPQLEKEYISTGKIKFVYRDFILSSHSFAQRAAIATRCAGKKGKFWEIFDKLSNCEKLDQKAILQSAEAIGLNKDEFDKCSNDSQLKEEVEKDRDDAAKFGVRGTPTFFINGRMVLGAVSFETFKKLIDEELSKTKKH